jgi:hypothetical protein
VGDHDLVHVLRSKFVFIFAQDLLKQINSGVLAQITRFFIHSTFIMKVVAILVLLLVPAVAVEVTPVQKVIQLMEGMLAKGQLGLPTGSQLSANCELRLLADFD